VAPADSLLHRRNLTKPNYLDERLRLAAEDWLAIFASVLETRTETAANRVRETGEAGESNGAPASRAVPPAPGSP